MGFFHPRTIAIFSSELRIIFNRRVLLAAVICLWLILVVVYKTPHEPQQNEALVLYRQIARTLTKSRFYGHEDISQSQYFTPREKKMVSLDFPYVLNAADVCVKSKPFLLITVMSLPKNTALRKAIRETYGRVARGGSWPGKHIHGDVRMVFMFGASKSPKENQILQEEAKMYKDIVCVNFTESYFNLTYKVLMSMKWATEFCPDAKFFMKADEDTFVDVPRLTDVLRSINMTNQIYGKFHYEDRVERSGKSKVTMQAYPLPIYPPHVKGNMYVMPLKLAVNIMHIAQYLPYVNMEDAHMTGIVAKLFDTRHHAIPSDQYDGSHPPKMCDFALNRRIISQQVNATLAYKLWRAIEDPTLCIS